MLYQPVHPTKFEFGDTLDPVSKPRFREIAHLVFNDSVGLALSNTDQISKEITQLHNTCLNIVNSLFMNLQDGLKFANFEKQTKNLLKGLGFAVDPEQLEKLIESLACHHDPGSVESTTGEDNVDHVVEALKDKYEVIPKDWTSRYELRGGRIVTPDKRSLTARDLVISPKGEMASKTNYFKDSDSDQSLKEKTAKKKGLAPRVSKFEEDTDNKKKKHESRSQPPKKTDSTEGKRQLYSDAEDKETLIHLNKIGERLDSLALRMKGRNKMEDLNITFQAEDPAGGEGEGKLESLSQGESLLLEESSGVGKAILKKREQENKASPEEEKQRTQTKKLAARDQGRLKTEESHEGDLFPARLTRSEVNDETEDEEELLRTKLSEIAGLGGHEEMRPSQMRMTLRRPEEISGFMENLKEFITTYDINEFLNGDENDFPPETSKLRLEFEK